MGNEDLMLLSVSCNALTIATLHFTIGSVMKEINASAKGILLAKIAYRKNVPEAVELVIAITKLAFVNALKDTLELIVAKELWDSLKKRTFSTWIFYLPSIRSFCLDLAIL
jgi:hypothetical protein